MRKGIKMWKTKIILTLTLTILMANAMQNTNIDKREVIKASIDEKERKVKNMTDYLDNQTSENYPNNPTTINIISLFENNSNSNPDSTNLNNQDLIPSISPIDKLLTEIYSSSSFTPDLSTEKIFSTASPIISNSSTTNEIIVTDDATEKEDLDTKKPFETSTPMIHLESSTFTSFTTLLIPTDNQDSSVDPFSSDDNKTQTISAQTQLIADVETTTFVSNLTSTDSPVNSSLTNQMHVDNNMNSTLKNESTMEDIDATSAVESAENNDDKVDNHGISLIIATENTNTEKSESNKNDDNENKNDLKLFVIDDGEPDDLNSNESTERIVSDKVKNVTIINGTNHTVGANITLKTFNVIEKSMEKILPTDIDKNETGSTNVTDDILNFTTIVIDTTELLNTTTTDSTTKSTTTNEDVTTQNSNKSNPILNRNYNFQVYEKSNVACILTNMDITLKVSYTTIHNKTVTKKIKMPDSAAVTGSCGENMSILTFFWFENSSNNMENSVTFKIENDGTSFYVNNIDTALYLDSENFPNAADTFVKGNSPENLKLFSASIDNGIHICNTLTEIHCGKITLLIEDVALIAFNKNQDISHRQEESCLAPKTVSFVAIVGGIVGLVITIGIITSYAWYRKRTSTFRSELP